MSLVKKVFIESAYDFFDQMHKLECERQVNEHVSCVEFYRGHSNCNYRLMSSLYRGHDNKGTKTYLTNFENDLINEFQRIRPIEFNNNIGYFNLLAKMQHYGMITRLLDITANPAVALFFACYDNNSEDGEVFVFKTQYDDIPDNETMNIIADFSIYRQKYGNTLKEQYITLSYNYPKYKLAKLLNC